MHQSHYINGSPAEKACYKFYSHTLTRTKDLAKKLYYHDQLKKFKNNPRKTWEILRTLLPSKTNSVTSSPNHIMVNNSPLFNSAEIAEAFNTHFVSVGKNLANSVNFDSNTDANHSHLKNPCLSSIYFQPTSPHEVLLLINFIKLNKASGYDDIEPRFLKLAYTISIILNHCFMTGIFPDKLKLAEVVPVFKKVSTNQLNN